MLLAPWGAFYKNVEVVDGNIKASDSFETLRFFEFPTAPQSLHMVLSLYATTEVRGFLSHRVRRQDDELFHSKPAKVHFPDPGTARQFEYLYDIFGVIFPRPGLFHIDILFDRDVLYTARLAIIQIK
jgi:uncharacterized protein DUF6941